ncbi:MAG: hypothetical protein ACE5HW_02145 [Candidatus Methanofastidiosia archaeon]
MKSLKSLTLKFKDRLNRKSLALTIGAIIWGGFLASAGKVGEKGETWTLVLIMLVLTSFAFGYITKSRKFSTFSSFLLTLIALGEFPLRKVFIVFLMVNSFVGYFSGKRYEGKVLEKLQKEPIFESEKILLPCVFCGKLIPEKIEICPYCKKPLHRKTRISELESLKERIQKALDNLEIKFMSDEIDQKTYQSLKGKWLKKLADLEEDIISEEVRRKK